MREQIEQLFITNKDKYYTGNYLKELFGITTIVLQELIHEMRIDGITIVSSGYKGYKFTTNKNDIMDTIQSLRNRANSIYMVSDGMYHGMMERLEERIDNEEG